MARILRRTAGVAAAMAATLALGATGALAGGPSATIQVEGNADLLPDGSVVMTVHYSCLPGTANPNGFFVIDLQQPQAAGFAADNAICDGSVHTVTENVRPGPFVPGSAAATVQLVAPNATDDDQVEVLIH